MGFTGFKTATAEELPQARTLMDPIHVIHVASEALRECRHRAQQHYYGVEVGQVNDCSRADGYC